MVEIDMKKAKDFSIDCRHGEDGESVIVDINITEDNGTKWKFKDVNLVEETIKAVGDCISEEGCASFQIKNLNVNVNVTKAREDEPVEVYVKS